MPGIEVTNRAVFGAGKDGNCRILISFFVFATEIVLKRTGAGTQESQSVPASAASVIPKGYRIRSCNDRQIETGSQVMCDAVHAVDPGGTHGAWRRLFLPEHELINDDRAVRPGKKLTEPYGTDRIVPCIEFHGTFLEGIVLDNWTFGKLAS